MCLPCGKARALQGLAGQKQKSWGSVFHRDADLLVPASGKASQTLMAAINKNNTHSKAEVISSGRIRLAACISRVAIHGLSEGLRSWCDLSSFYWHLLLPGKSIRYDESDSIYRMNTTSLSLLDFRWIYIEKVMLPFMIGSTPVCARLRFVLEYTRNELKTAFRINMQGKDTSELLAMSEQQWAQSNYKARRIKKLSPLN